MAMTSLLCEVGGGVLNPNFVCNYQGAFSGLSWFGRVSDESGWFGAIGCTWGRSLVSEGKAKEERGQFI